MAEGIRLGWVGCARFQDGGRADRYAIGEVAKRTVYGRPHEVIDVLAGLPGPVRAVYEAGPTGCGLARRARAAGIDVQVCAPGMIVNAGPGSRVKTDAKGALKLARLLGRRRTGRAGRRADR